MLHARWINGNLAYWDTHQCRIVDAIGANVVKCIEEFDRAAFASADNLAAWTTTLVEAGAGETTLALVGGADGGHLLITTDAAENDGANVQLQGECFGKMVSGKQAYFGVRFKISEATQSDFLFGLCITDTDLLGGMTDGIYFRKADGSTTMSFVLEKNSTETSTNYGTAIAADTWYTLEFFFDGSDVHWWVNGTEQTTPATTNLCDDEWLTPSMHFLTGAAAAITCTVDWVKAIQFNS